MEKKLVGYVIDYFANIGVAAIEIESGEIRIGDKVHLKGYTTDFIQEIDSIQIDKEQVDAVMEGDCAGIKVDERVREGDEVYKILSE